MPSPLTGAAGGAANPTPGVSLPSLMTRAALRSGAHASGAPSHASGCITTAQCHPGTRVLAFPIVSPIMHWLGGEASKAIGDVWQAAMTGLWSAALWLLQLAFQVIDQFTTPDLSASGPMGSVLPTTLWIGAAVAVLMMFIQLAVALVRRDGQSLGRVFLGIAQFGAAWIAYLGVAGGLVAAAAGLEKGILSATLHVNTFSGINLSASWPRNVNDVVLATVLGVLSLLLVMPAAFFYLIIMFVREAALILLVATAPISAAGLLADASKVWFWKSLRWFIACLLISPTTALVLGIGVQVSAGVVSGEGDKTAAAAGMAVVGCIMIAIGACCPLVLFRLLAFVDPSTASGAALRQSWSDAGGMSGLMSGNGAQAVGGTAAAQSGSDGRSGGETNAESQTRGRLAAAMGAVGQGMQTAVSLAHKAADVGSDVLGSTGVGHPGYSLTHADTRANRRQPVNSAGTTGGGEGDGGEGSGSDGSSAPPPGGPTPPGGSPGVSTVAPPQRSRRPGRTGRRGGRRRRGRWRRSSSSGGRVMSATTSAPAGQDTAVRYGGWSKDRQGWFLGLSGGAWVVIIAGGLPALLAAGAHRWPLALGWLPVWGVLIVAVAVPVRGRPALRWVIDCLYRAVGIVARRSHWQSHAATGIVDRLDEVDLPGVLSGVRTHDGPPFGPLLARPAIIADNRERTWAVVARIHHPGIGLAEAMTRARMGAGLSGLLDAAATAELISLVTLQVRTIPDDGAERAAWQRSHLRPDAPALAHAVTGELLAVMTQAGVRHEAFLTVVVPESRIARHAKEAGGGVDGRARVLYGVMATLEAGLLGPLGASAVVWLDSAGLAAAIRTGFAPGDRAMLRTAELERTDGATRWPMAAVGPSTAPPPERRHYQHDAWHTVTATVLLPDRGAVMGALAPVFTPTEAGERRCVTVFFEPIPRHKADRLIGAQAMSAGTAAELRTRMGFRTRAVHRRDAARVEGQDQRLAEGSALVRSAVAAAVTVPDTWPIADYGRRLESAITAAGFSPLRLDLAQDSGFAAACIPLGIGLPRRRGIR